MAKATVALACAAGAVAAIPGTVSGATANTIAGPNPLAGTALPALDISEFPLQTPYQEPLAITAGPDGRLWFTQGLSTLLGVSTTSGALSSVSGLNAPAAGIASDAGDLWVTQPTANEVAQITPAGTVTEFPLSQGREPVGIAAGPDGNVWFTEIHPPAQIGRITPSGTITYFSAGLPGAADPISITAGPDGNLWFTEGGGPTDIGRITPGGTITQFPIEPPANGNPISITAGPDGNLWFTEEHGIGRITTSGTVTLFTTGLNAGSRPTAITAGLDGNLWFTDAASPGAIGSVTPSGVITEVDTPTAGSAPDGITVGPDGRIWFTEPGGSGAIAASTIPAPATSGTTTPTPVATTTTTTTTTTPTTTTVTTGPPVTTPAPPLTTPAPPPQTAVTASVGKTAVADVRSGTVLVRTATSGKLVPLTGNSAIPVGSLVDAGRGVLRLTTELVGGHRSQAVTVWGGSFVVSQARHSSKVLLTLANRPSCGRAPAASGSFASAIARPAASKPTTRLWAHDNHGQYSTRGYNSVATVRGTVWETVNTCAGTVTYVKRGLVSVRDLHRHRTVLVRAGHSYLARS